MVLSIEVGGAQADLMDAVTEERLVGGSARVDRSQFELNLVSDGNAEVTDGRDLGLEAPARFVDGSRTERGEAEAAAPAPQSCPNCLR